MVTDLKLRQMVHEKSSRKWQNIYRNPRPLGDGSIAIIWFISVLFLLWNGEKSVLCLFVRLLACLQTHWIPCLRWVRTSIWIMCIYKYKSWCTASHAFVFFTAMEMLTNCKRVIGYWTTHGQFPSMIGFSFFSGHPLYTINTNRLLQSMAWPAYKTWLYFTGHLPTPSKKYVFKSGKIVIKEMFMSCISCMCINIKKTNLSNPVVVYHCTRVCYN